MAQMKSKHLTGDHMAPVRPNGRLALGAKKLSTNRKSVTQMVGGTQQTMPAACDSYSETNVGGN